MSDIKFTLDLDTRKFSAKLEKTKKEVSQFQATLAGVAISGINSLSKFAAAINLPIKAGDAFIKVIRSSGETSRLFDNNLNAAKGTVDAFFRSIATGSFSAFSNGLNAAYDHAFRLSDMMDKLANKKASFEVIQGNSNLEIERYQAVALDPSNPMKDREEAAGAVYASIDQLKKDGQSVINANKEELIARFKEAGRDLSYEELVSFVFDIQFGGSGEVEDFKQYQATKKRLEDTIFMNSNRKTPFAGDGNLVIGSLQAPGFDPQAGSEARKKLTELKSSNPKFENYSYLATLPAEDMEYLLKTLMDNTARENSFLQLDQRAGNIQKSIEGDKKEKFIVDFNIPVPTEADMQKLAEDAFTTLLSSGDTLSGESREIINIKVDPIADEAILLDTTPLEGSLAALESRIEVLRELYQNAENDGLRSIYAGQIADIEKQMNAMDVLGEKTIKTRNLNQDLADSFSAVGGMMSNLSGIVGGSAGTWMGWGASVMQSVAQALPAIMSLTVATTAKAAAESASSAAQIPFVGWMLAAGAALSVVAAMASVPKCANGGIAMGRTLVEVGEYSGAVSNPEVIAPLNKLRDLIKPASETGSVIVSGDWKARGSDLYLVLNNYMKKTGKKL